MALPRQLSDDDPQDDWDGADWAGQVGPRLGDLLDAERGEDLGNLYSEDWLSLSCRLREQMDWCCERCGINLCQRHDLLHVHHIDRRKRNNIRSNLAVVCALCHSRFLGHEHIFDRLNQADREMLLDYWRRTGRT